MVVVVSVSHMPIIIRSSSYPVKYSCAMYFHGKVDLMQSCLIFQIILYHRVTTYYVQRNFMGEWLSEIAGPYYRNLGGGEGDQSEILLY